MEHFNHAYIALTIILAGLLGGIINYYLVHIKEEEFSNTYIFLKSLFLGIGASALIPLFLKLIGSNLLDQDNKPYPPINYYVIGGFCLAAAIYSKRFIEDVYGRITKVEDVAKEAKKTAEQAKATTQEIEEAVTEPEQVAEVIGQEGLTLERFDPADVNRQSVLSAIKESPYLYRNATGIARQTGIDQSTLENLLKEMTANGMIKPKTDTKGNLVYKALS